MEGLNSPFVNGGSAAGSSSTACSPRLRVLLGALVAGAVITHLVLLGMLMSEQSGHVSSAMVYCEVDGDDALTYTTNNEVCSSTSAEGQVQCSGSIGGGTCGTASAANVIGSFEWKVSYALAQDCTVLGSQLATGKDGTPRQPMLCPAAMQAATKQQGRCTVPPTPCNCDGGSKCSSTPK
jgi:hypothetical protein